MKRFQKRYRLQQLRQFQSEIRTYQVQNPDIGLHNFDVMALTLEDQLYDDFEAYIKRKTEEGYSVSYHVGA